MQFFSPPSSLGVPGDADTLVGQRANVINGICLASSLMALFFLVVSNLYQWPYVAKFIALTVSIIILIPIVLNRLKKHVLSALFFMLFTIGLITFLPILFGLRYHFQVYFLGGVGLPFVLLNANFGKWRYIFSFSYAILWALVQFGYGEQEGLVSLGDDLVNQIVMMNYGMSFITISCGTFIFTIQSDRYRKIIKQQYEGLLEVNKKLANFSYVVSHDLKAPIANISSIVRLVKEDSKAVLSEFSMEMLTLIDKSSVQSMDMIQAVLRYSLVTNEEINQSEFDLEAFLDKIRAKFYGRKKLEIECRGEIPSLWGSEVQLEQIVSNLVDNAIKYHDKPEGWVKIAVDRNGPNQLHFKVQDNGPGIPPKLQSEVFKLFSKNPNTGTESSGIGLAVVKNLVEKSGNSIGIQSEAGEGTTFWFTWDIKAPKSSVS